MSEPSPVKPAFINSDNFIFSVGIISPKKNFKVLIPLLQLNPELSLVIAGLKNGEYAQELEEYAKELQVFDRLVMPGAVSESDKSWLYKNCKAFMFPSLSEGFGLPVIEAMSFGKPVFLSSHTSLPEIGGKEAYYFNSFGPEDMAIVFRDGLKDFLLDSQKISRTIDYATSYSWESAADQYVNLYRSL